MPVVNVELAKEAESLQGTVATFNKEVQERNMRNWRRQIILAGLALTALFLRFGIPTNDLPIVPPRNSTTPLTGADELTWFEHPVVLYVVGVLMAPVVLLAVVAAAEPNKDNVPFFTVLIRKYYSYLRGMFLASILVDSAEVFVEGNPPATLYTALHSYLQGNQWIDPYTSNDKLWTLSYQATITGFVACYCLMMINKALHHRLAKRTYPSIILRTAAILIVSAVVVLASQNCYYAYYSADSRDFVQFYFLSVLLGMVIAILEVQGKNEYELPLKRYKVVMRKAHNTKAMNDDLDFGIDLSKHTPLDRHSSAAKKIEQIAMECYLHCTQPDMSFKNYPFSDPDFASLFRPLYNPLLAPYIKDGIKEEAKPDVKVDMEPEFKNLIEK